MRKYIKAGVLLFVLVAPVLVFLFLKFFGQNHYTIKTYFPERIDSLAVGGQLKIDTIFYKVPSFKLISQYGIWVTDEVTDNIIYVANFFPKDCSDSCPTILSELSRVQDVFESNQDIKIISHVLDSGHVSVSIAADFAKKYRALKGKWYFLVGKGNEIKDLAQKGYMISHSVGSQMNEALIQPGKLILIDKNKHIRGWYDGTDREEVDRLIVEMKILQYEDKLKN